jgi:hypothetical protein
LLLKEIYITIDFFHLFGSPLLGHFPSPKLTVSARHEEDIFFLAKVDGLDFVREFSGYFQYFIFLVGVSHVQLAFVGPLQVDPIV